MVPQKTVLLPVSGKSYRFLLHTGEVLKEVLFSAGSLSHMPQNLMAELPMLHPSSVTVLLPALDSLKLPPFLFLVFPRRNHP